MSNIPIGTTREQKVLVSNENAINFLGMDGARVLSTPHMAVIATGTWKKMILKIAPCDASFGYPAMALISRVSRMIAMAPRRNKILSRICFSFLRPGRSTTASPRVGRRVPRLQGSPQCTE